MEKTNIKALITELLAVYDITVLPVKGFKDYSGVDSADEATNHINNSGNCIVRLLVKGSSYNKDGNGYVGYIKLTEVAGGMAYAETNSKE